MRKGFNVSELQAKKTDYNIPTFGYKSALVILLGAVIATIIIPSILSVLGISNSFSILIGNTFITSLAIAYSRFFIETKRGYCKAFWINYGLFALSFGIISYFWRYIGLFI